MAQDASTIWPETSTSEAALDKSSTVDQDACTWYNVCIRVVLGGSLVVFGLIGNGLTMVIMGRERHKSSTIRMLFYLAIVDSLILLVYGTMAIPVPVLGLMDANIAARNLQTVSIAILAHIGQMLNQISVLFTVIVTWQRYVSVCIPLKTKKYTSANAINALTVVSVLFAGLFYFPSFFQHRFITKPNGVIMHIPAGFAKSSSYEVVYAVILLYLVSYVLPIIALVFMGVSLVQSLRQTKTQEKSIISQTTKIREQMTLCLVIVVIIFVICQSIGPTRRILMKVVVPYRLAVQCGGSLFYLGPWVLVSLLINSAVNFVIYVLCARAFRRKVQRLLCVCRKNRVQGIDVSVSQLTVLDRSKTVNHH